jgi:hypothetical protein
MEAGMKRIIGVAVLGLFLTGLVMHGADKKS